MMLFKSSLINLKNFKCLKEELHSPFSSPNTYVSDFAWWSHSFIGLGGSQNIENENTLEDSEVEQRSFSSNINQCWKFCSYSVKILPLPHFHFESNASTWVAFSGFLCHPLLPGNQSFLISWLSLKKKKKSCPFNGNITITYFFFCTRILVD